MLNKIPANKSAFYYSHCAPLAFRSKHSCVYCKYSLYCGFKSCFLCCSLVLYFFFYITFCNNCYTLMNVLLLQNYRKLYAFNWNWIKTPLICHRLLIWQKIGWVLMPFGPAGEWRLACPECPWHQVLSTSRLLFQCLMKLFERRLNGREGQNNNHSQSPSFRFIR